MCYVLCGGGECLINMWSGMAVAVVCGLWSVVCGLWCILVFCVVAVADIYCIRIDEW